MDITGEHVVALVAVVAATAALCVAARRWPGPWLPWAAASLGAFVAATEASWIVWLVAQRAWTPDVGLPLHLCDAAALLAALALWTRRQVPVELLYFWACAGAVQALLTPDVPEPFPGFLYWQYYAGHGAVVAAALLLVVGTRRSLRPGAVRRSALLTAGYAAAVGLVDAFTGGNYLYLRQPPPVRSLLDVMGPWPWYLVTCTGLAVALFALLNLPFWAARIRAPAPVSAPPSAPIPARTAGPTHRGGPGPSWPG